jgi:hypothetical protein
MRLRVTKARAAVAGALLALGGVGAALAMAQSSAPAVTPTAVSIDATVPPPPVTCSQGPFCGDFETGNINQWDIFPHEGTGGLPTVVTSPVAQGTYAGQFQVTPDSGAGPDRSEAYIGPARTGATPGQDWYYGWWTDFPGPSQSWWNLGGDWNDIVQLNEVHGARYIYIGVDATGNRTPGPNIYMNASTGHYVLTSLAYDHWYHFVVHIHWATDNTGLLEVTLDGQTVVPATSGPTLPADNPQGVWSIGVYRGAWPSTNTVIHDGLCRAASYDAAAVC